VVKVARRHYRRFLETQEGRTQHESVLGLEDTRLVVAKQLGFRAKKEASKYLAEREIVVLHPVQVQSERARK
jgi:hypothetical protein